jgi:hypothetical protein
MRRLSTDAALGAALAGASVTVREWHLVTFANSALDGNLDTLTLPLSLTAKPLVDFALHADDRTKAVQVEVGEREYVEEVVRTPVRPASHYLAPRVDPGLTLVSFLPHPQLQHAVSIVHEILGEEAPGVFSLFPPHALHTTLRNLTPGVATHL